MKEYGRFDTLTNEYVITTPLTPRAWENRMWNNDLNVQVNNHGGRISYRRDHEGRFVLYNYTGETAVYVLDRTSGKFWSCAWSPVNAGCDFYEARCGVNYTDITTETGGVRATWRNTVHPSEPAELWQLEFTAVDGRPHDLLVTVYYRLSINFRDPYFGACDRYRCENILEDDILYIKNYSPRRDLEYYAVGMASSRKIVKYEQDMRSFFKNFSGFSAPYTAMYDKFTSSAPDVMETSNSAPVLAAGFDMTARPGVAEKLDLAVFSAVDRDDAGRCAKICLSSPDPVAEAKKAHAARFAAVAASDTLKCALPGFDNLVNVFLKNQLRYNAEWNRGWAIGFRDSMQDCDAWSRLDPELARQRLLQAAGHIFADGHTVRKFAGVDDKMYFDGGVWFVNTAVGYLRETGDMALLEQEVPYFRSDEKGSMLDHMKRAMDFLDSRRGPNGICRMGFGDWNDALNGVDREGRGESIWTTEACIWALGSLVSLLEHLGDADAARYAALMQEFTAKLRTDFFEGDRYIRAVTDDGTKVGSRDSAAGKIYLNAQAWAIIAKVATPEQIPLLYSTAERELGTGYGMLLLAPPYTEYDPRIGRISSDDPGLRENGGNYVHASMFHVYALASCGMAEEAWLLLKRLLPDNPENPPEKSCLEPWSLTNAYEGPASAHPGRAMFAWRTGSCAWMMKSIHEAFLGINCTFEGVRITPHLPSQWGARVETVRMVRGKAIRFIFAAGCGDAGIKAQYGDLLPYSALDGVKTVHVAV